MPTHLLHSLYLSITSSQLKSPISKHKLQSANCFISVISFTFPLIDYTMEDRVHPAAGLEHSHTPPDAVKQPISDDKPLLQQGTYVIQIPKDQIYRIPPPENSQKIKKLANRKPRRSCCCRCFCWTIATAFILLILLGISTGILYLVFRPEKLNYSIDSISIGGINLTSTLPMSPRITVGIRADNPNNKLSVYYNGKGSSVNIYYADVNLCSGVLPSLEQPTNNVTVIKTALKGSNIVLARNDHSRLVSQQKKRNVPLRLRVKAPLKIKIGAVKTWEITVTVKCDVAVDQFSLKSKIVSKSCDYGVKLW